MKRVFLILACVTMGLASCDKDDNNMYSYSLPQEGIALEEDLIKESAIKLINSEQEYKEFTHSETTSGINFSKQTLIAVYGFCPAGIDKITDAIEQHDDKYQIAVDVFYDYTFPLIPWSVAYVVPKMTDITKVEAHVEYKLSYINK